MINQRYPRESGGRLSGFTFIEILIALSIAAILAAIAIPSLHQTQDKISTNLAQQALLQQIQQAQQIANAKMVGVGMCLSDNGKLCVDQSTRMICSFIDHHHDGKMHEESQVIACNLLREEGMMHLRAYPKYRHYLLLLPVIENTSDNGTFWFCSKNQTVQWAVAVSQSGEAHVVKDVSNMGLAC